MIPGYSARHLAYIRIRPTALALLVWTLSWALTGFCSDLALVHAKIYRSPTQPAITDGVILVRGSRIVAVGPGARVKVPIHANVIDCQGRAVTAGFWNSHVHILFPGILHAEKLTSRHVSSELQEMFTRWGFTTVFDIASVQQNTTLIRRRIESGEVTGPTILTVGEPFWVKGGTPIYIKGFLEANHIVMPEVSSPEQAVVRVRQQINGGADAIKIFANSVERDRILTMPSDLAKAIVAEAHRAGKPVFAHVSNDQGIEVALQSGVDILAHTTPAGDLWSAPFAERLVAAHIALTPTLTLWDVEAKKGGVSSEQAEKWMSRAAEQLKAFSEAGGEVLFGTDVGYIEQFDTSEEFTWMARAGLNFQQILASLTTNPSARFGYSSHRGRIAEGMDADLVVLNGDPGKDVIAFSKVHQVIRGGQLIYQAR
ncbi:Pro-Hyp dipeptidase [Candidatus Koribacter versatilis Ellin345]|uniref:Pro-Hyp dipeptidase n=1 Tax=Koribacter versatilis (strain Ellin345) TaxID=204669 RepID=Q1IKV8_KORVE|nr:amidohydrolase family protein [Candidatus Koribacter versatilis]ABF42492.1 Pro-Hyp dipeptidase [Candidatus Koribacter versatilis Ellin345]